MSTYQSRTRHLEIGWLVDNEVEARIETLETVIAKANLGRKSVQNSSEYLYSEFCPIGFMQPNRTIGLWPIDVPCDKVVVQ